MSEWKYIDSIAELSDFECAHCDTRDFYMVTYDTISQPWKVLNKFLKKNRIIVEQCSFNKDEIIPLLKSLETASGGEGDWRHLVLDSIDHWWIKISVSKDLVMDNTFVLLILLILSFRFIRINLKQSS